MLWRYFTYLHESDQKFLHLPCTNIAVNVTKVVIKILQGSAVTQRGLVIDSIVTNFVYISVPENNELR